MDIIYLPEVDGYRYCLTIIDRFSRWLMAIPIKDMTATTTATAVFNNWICQFGTPLTITTDQGSQFESILFTALCNVIGAKHRRTSPYHPASNGIIERWHRTIKTALKCNPHVPWPDLLPSVLLGLRTAYKDDLKASPAELLYGTTLRIPGDFFVSSQLEADPEFFIEKHCEYMRAIAPRPTSHHIKARPFTHKTLYKCTHVFLRTDAVSPPLTPPYSGPHLIVERIDDRCFRIRIEGEDKIIYVERLKPSFISDTDTGPPTTRSLTPDPQPSTSKDNPKQPLPLAHTNPISIKRVKFKL